MMSQEYGFLFVHVPKTGGNAVQGHLRDFSPDEVYLGHARADGVERFGVRNSLCKELTKHSTISDYTRCLGDDVVGGLTTFTTVRNPWSWCLSRYLHSGREWDRGHFESWLDVQKMWQLDWISASDRSDVVSGRRPPTVDVDRVMRLESLTEDFAEVCDMLGLPRIDLPVRNAGSHGHYTEYYDVSLRDKVAELCAPEIELFGYSYGD